MFFSSPCGSFFIRAIDGSESTRCECGGVMLVSVPWDREFAWARRERNNIFELHQHHTKVIEI